jgi:hypothetical protein
MSFGLGRLPTFVWHIYDSRGQVKIPDAAVPVEVSIDNNGQCNSVDFMQQRLQGKSIDRANSSYSNR